MPRKSSTPNPGRLRKAPTGIDGFDIITGGGLPAGRPTLVCGGPGCGKSLFAAEFLMRGALEYHEPGVLMTFEESADDIVKNVASLGFDVRSLVAKKQLLIDHVRVRRNEIEENGDYDLEGLFIRLDHAIRTVGAKRVVLDTIEALFAGLANQAILRSELQRLFAWLKDRGMTAVITGEKGDSTLTRQGLEEYVSDCVLLLDHRVNGQVSTRRLRVVKYRGSFHGTNEYPFMIDRDGISVFPITSSRMDYRVTNRRISSGVQELDDMLGGRGYFRGSTILLSGTAGTGKTSLSAHLADATCRRGEKCLFFSFEESPDQIMRNMGSIGIDLRAHVRRQRLRFDSARPTMHGLEAHLVRMHKLIAEFKPDVVIVDPLSNLQAAGTVEDSASMLVRLFDYLRWNKTTGFFVSLTSAGHPSEATDESISSIVDTWLLLRDIEFAGERNRALYILKSRGMAHSNQIREFLITKKGVRLIPAYVGPSGVLTGSARLNQEVREAAEEATVRQSLAQKKTSLAHRRAAVEAEIEALRAGFRAEADKFDVSLGEEQQRVAQLQSDRLHMARSRRVILKPKHGP